MRKGFAATGSPFLCLLLTFVVTCATGAEPLNFYVFDLAYISDLTPECAYEHQHVVAALCGLANRDDLSVYIELTSTDSEWLEWSLSSGKWLEGYEPVSVSSLEELLSALSSFYTGVVLYDTNVPSTSMVASTIAGIEKLLPIPYRPSDPDSLYNKLVVAGLQLPVVKSLVGMFNGSISGSSKCDAYLWAKDQYMDTGLANPCKMGYYLDWWWTTVAETSGLPYYVNTVTNHDYFISQRGFFWDLDVWWDETPNDDPSQPLGTDPNTLTTLLLAAYQQSKSECMIHVGGFTPWAFKYVGWKHEGVETEWQTAKITSAYNAYIDADACCIQQMANAAFFHHMPLKLRYAQNPAPTYEDLVSKGYIVDDRVARKTYFMFYVGDYDSAAWVYNEIKGFWDDPERGTVPLGWAVNPNLAERIPLAFEYMMTSLTPNDRLITGDSGSGYVNPTQLLEPRQISNLTSAESLWVQYNIPYYRQFSITFTGFLINGASGTMTKEAEMMYTSFSWDGMVEQFGYEPSSSFLTEMVQNTPVFEEVDISGSAQDAANTILSYHTLGSIQFQVYRGILQTPSWYKQVVDIVQSKRDIVVVDPVELAYLARYHMQGNNDNRVAYINDTLPASLLHTGESFQLAVTTRNDGWNTLYSQSCYLHCHFDSSESSELCGFYLTADIMSGDYGQVVGEVPAIPLLAGSHTFTYQLTQQDGTPFSQFGNIPWEAIVQVL